MPYYMGRWIPDDVFAQAQDIIRKGGRLADAVRLIKKPFGPQPKPGPHPLPVPAPDGGDWRRRRLGPRRPGGPVLFAKGGKVKADTHMMPEHHAAAHGKDDGSLSGHMRQIAEDKGKKPPLGSGERFAAIEAHARASGARNPAAVAAAAGIKAHGKKRMAQMAAAGRKRAAKARK